MPVRQRPFGVTILAILDILMGLASLVGALGMFAIAALIGSDAIREAIGNAVPQWVIDNATIIFGALGAITLLTGILAFLLAYGFLNGKRWAWVLGIAFGVFSIASSVVQSLLLGTFNIVTVGFSILIPVLIIVYLLQPNVKAWFTA